ncbi:hypothetical protein UPYG_G00053820 [Umbra pygmaea]|uniref:Ig-like domain-containing protein n=1 Tax=Umbra pygmaea TaxID=75934 RepID=A0ABD0XB88_UMBPY
MKIIHVVCYLLSALCLEASPYRELEEGYEGGNVTFQCSQSRGRLHSNNIYFFKFSGKGDNGDILVQAKDTKKVTQGRYSLENTGGGSLTVTIRELKKSDSGLYKCQVKWIDGAVHLIVKDALPITALPILEVPHINLRPFQTTSNIPTTFPNLPATSAHHATPGPIRNHTPTGPIRGHLSSRAGPTDAASVHLHTPEPALSVHLHTTEPALLTTEEGGTPIIMVCWGPPVLFTPGIIMVCVSLSVLVLALILLLIYKRKRDRKASNSPTQNFTYKTLNTALNSSTY